MREGFDGLAPCVHCGFCLQSCPTYLVTSDESDSPRGRIVLMRQLERDESDPDDPMLVRHLDRCLGCRACEPVCPSGVRYGSGLEAARSLIAARRPPGIVAKAVLATMALPALRTLVLGGARIARPLAAALAGTGRIGFGMGMLASTNASAAWQRGSVAEHALPPTLPRCHAGAVFLGCIQRELFSHVHRATRRTLEANGVCVVDVPEQGCCGALHAHAGLLDDARALARTNIAAFAAEPDAAIVVNSAGCGAMLKEYGALFADTPLATRAAAFSARVRDVTETLAERGPRVGGAVPIKAAYDPPCHLVHAQRVADPPLQLLRAIPDLEIVPHDEADLCCGSAGIYSLLEPDLSRAVLARKVAALGAAKPDVVATGNPGCAMQIGAGLRAAGVRIPVVHPVELLDRSYAVGGIYGGRAIDSEDA